MIRLLFILAIFPLFASSQIQGISFWGGTPEPEPGCKTWEIVTANCEPCISYITYTDCYGNEMEMRMDMDGGIYYVCSNERPVAHQNAPPLQGILSISETGYDCDGNIIYIPCGSETNAMGKNEFPAEFVSFIGSYTGDVTFHFTTGDVPDKVVIERMDGTVIYTTGWRGDPSYQSALSQGLANLGLPDETILPPGGMDGATYTFNKNFIETTIRVKVYTSYWITGGSSWWVTVNCPN